MASQEDDIIRSGPPDTHNDNPSQSSQPSWDLQIIPAMLTISWEGGQSRVSFDSGSGWDRNIDLAAGR